ncbi:hypothetical protein ACFQYP_49105 [Nonomuraea antimicrobica]|uniref:hypothetical protein n=1 Tax=Nonomuraea antimicrobica TaxID=561173 RepID=UPI0031ECA5DC
MSWSRAPRPILVKRCWACSYASMEMRIAFPALLERFPGLRVSPWAEVRAFQMVYGPASLPVAW